MHELLRVSVAALELELRDEQFLALENYAKLIRKWSRITNLVGSSSIDELIRNHVVDCLSAVPHIDGKHIADVGSGAGFPGVVIAIMCPHSKVTLVESHQRKCRFLRQVGIELSLDNIAVVAERIETWCPQGLFDTIVCRGFSSLQKFYDDTSHLHHPACELIAMKAVRSDQEVAALNAPGARVRTIPLTVPGWDHRHLVSIHCQDFESAGSS